MRIFIYEYTTGGGLLSDDLGAIAPHSLVAEGAAMVHALAEDFSALGGVEVVVMRDVERAPDLNLNGRVYEVADATARWRLFEQLSRDSDWTLIIAPELRGTLAACCTAARKFGGRLLNCTDAVIALASDKHSLAQYLAERGVRVPAGVHVRAGEPWPVDLDVPAVIKPCDGAGSQGIRWIGSLHELSHLPVPVVDYRLERFCPGLPASVGFLCGPKGNCALPACWQELGAVQQVEAVAGPARPHPRPPLFRMGRGEAPSFEYCGGSLPLPPELNNRAQTLAKRALDCLPELLGFVGVDLILGEAADGSQDDVIEVNPRMTTSYVGLRRATQQNLARAMIAVAAGELLELSFSDQSVHFTCDGEVAMGPL